MRIGELSAKLWPPQNDSKTGKFAHDFFHFLPSFCLRNFHPKTEGLDYWIIGSPLFTMYQLAWSNPPLQLFASPAKYKQKRKYAAALLISHFLYPVLNPWNFLHLGTHWHRLTHRTDTKSQRYEWERWQNSMPACIGEWRKMANALSLDSARSAAVISWDPRRLWRHLRCSTFQLVPLVRLVAPCSSKCELFPAAPARNYQSGSRQKGAIWWVWKDTSKAEEALERMMI